MNVQLVFQGLRKSDFVQSLVKNRIESVLSKFPQSAKGHATVYVGMENSPQHAGKNLFRVRLLWHEGRGAPLVLTKASANVYEAIADLAHGLVERVHRVHDRSLTRRRRAVRKLKESAYYDQLSETDVLSPTA